MNTTPDPAWPETVRARMRAKSLRGVPTGPVPLGYRKTRRGGRTWAEVHEETAPLVREAFRLAGLRRQSLRKVGVALAARGLVARNGRPLSAASLRKMLGNTFHLGFVRYGGEVVEGNHPPLVDWETFERAQAALADRRRVDPKRRS